MEWRLLINGKKEMYDFAAWIASQSQKNDIIGLVGNLGVGKSFFAAAFINSLLAKPIIVTSPTFNLVCPYLTKKGEVFHFDLYRIKNENELENIGLEEAIKNGISLIEWPIIAKNCLTKNYLEISIQFVKAKESRLVNLKSSDNYWGSRFKDLRTSFDCNDKLHP